MATTLSYGYVKPDTGDTGSVWFPALEDDITQLNDHNHDGVNSAPLSGAFLQPGLVQALAANWILVSSGVYEQTLTVPSSFNIDTSVIYFKRISDNSLIYGEIQKLSSTSFKIFSNTNTIGINVYFK